jgi:hypothetical protein
VAALPCTNTRIPERMCFTASSADTNSAIDQKLREGSEARRW